MPRNRTISPDFWTMEAVVDCQPMTRLLFIGLWNFADDFGVQPLRPRTIRMQVYPGDGLDAGAVPRMIDELAAQGLVRIYEVDGVAYVAIVDWAHLQPVGKRARRRYPAPASAVPAAQTIEDHRNAGTHEAASAQAIENHRNAATDEAASAQTIEDHRNAGPPPQEMWWNAIGARLRETWPDGGSIEALEPVATRRWIAQWIADGCDLERDVLTAISAAHSDPRRRPGPPAGLHELLLAVDLNRDHRLAARAAA